MVVTADTDDPAALLDRLKYARTSTDEPLPRCRECGCVATKKATSGRSHREHPEAWRCNNGHHFDDPQYGEDGGEGDG